MKVGDYVRTKDGKIFKWNNLCTTDKKDYEEHTRKILFVENEIKSSPNIIDLIEVGDYVNGSYIYSVVEENKNTGQPRVLFTECVLGNGDIKSIVTKEQFKNIEYEVE